MSFPKLSRILLNVPFCKTRRKSFDGFGASLAISLRLELSCTRATLQPSEYNARGSKPAVLLIKWDDVTLDCHSVASYTSSRQSCTFVLSSAVQKNGPHYFTERNEHFETRTNFHVEDTHVEDTHVEDTHVEVSELHCNPASGRELVLYKSPYMKFCANIY